MKLILTLCISGLLNIAFTQGTGNDTIPVVKTLTVGGTTLTFDNKGNLALPSGSGSSTVPGWRFLDKSLLSSAGFIFSGYINNTLFVSSVFETKAMSDYVPGIVGGSETDPRNGIYTINKSDIPFGESWQRYRYAVELGALYYDGDGNGIYNPVDLNNNNVWDANEDRPDILGDFMCFTVFNDNKTPALRRFTNMVPRGVEIHQYVFGYNTASAYYQNIVFVLYRLINKGTSSAVFDSCFFSLAVDPDLGNAFNDIAGTDITRSAGYMYEGTDDGVWGTEPPAFMVQFLQKPNTYIPNVTYIDVNLNNMYDAGIDTPVKTITNKFGPLAGEKIVSGTSYSNFYAVYDYLWENPTHGEVLTPFVFRNFQQGRTAAGEEINPCTYSFGNGAQLSDCASLNPRFIYNGFPENGSGWIGTLAFDHRLIVTSGPFRMERDKPVDIIGAYIVGKGNSIPGSVAAVREVADFSTQVYSSNFINLTTGANETEGEAPNAYLLQQNYPNPFNPRTTIQYGIESGGEVNIGLFDILGKEVMTIERTYREPGNYEVQLDASSLSSGVYFYVMKTNGIVFSKKLTILK